MFPAGVGGTVTPVITDAEKRCMIALGLYERNTRQIAKMLNMDYYSALARLKNMEIRKLLERRGVDRSKVSEPSIIWRVAPAYRDSK